MARHPGRRLVGGLALLAAAGAAFFYFAAFEARSRRNPSTVALGGQRYDARALPLPACPELLTMVVDVDLDDFSDLYARGCGGHGFVKSRVGGPVWVDLGDVDPDDAPGLSSLWVREIRDGGGRFVLAGSCFAALALAGVGWLVIAGLRRKSQ